MKKTILSIALSIITILAFSACSDLKKDATIRTIGGEKVKLSIKAPREFKKAKEAYFVMYTMYYMDAWNEGVSESENPKNEYKFNFEAFALSAFGAFQGDPFILGDMEEHFKSNSKLKEKFKSEGRAFANKQKK